MDGAGRRNLLSASPFAGRASKRPSGLAAEVVGVEEEEEEEMEGCGGAEVRG